MDYSEIDISHIDMLWELQKAYKASIGEDEPTEQNRAWLMQAIKKKQIRFFGAWNQSALVGSCSVTVGFSTFNYKASGVFEDFYIVPEYRNRGIARELVQYAYNSSRVSSLTVGCADCDLAMYRVLGFKITLGNLLALEL